MSPTIARNAFRAVQRRQFSMLTTMRHMARSFEPHPFQRMSPMGQAKPDYFKMIKYRLGTAGLYVFDFHEQHTRLVANPHLPASSLSSSASWAGPTPPTPCWTAGCKAFSLNL
jgi:hypothetical protein